MELRNKIAVHPFFIMILFLLCSFHGYFDKKTDFREISKILIL